MDPNATLAELRRTVGRLLDTGYGDTVSDGWHDDAITVLEHIAGLDEFLTRGGFFPSDWARHRTPQSEPSTPGADTHLIGKTTRATDFRNRARTVVKPAGTEVIVRIEAFEDANRCVLACIPGTRYSAALPKSMISPI